jgi:predicted unusual protein kinase regulating ubiquinone biosynthesis (AarF/ABC1/UbiB family)
MQVNDKYQVTQDKIGGGSFGQVFEGICNDDGSKVAVKRENKG